MISKIGLTQNGNEYKKSNTGKIIGAVPGTALLAAIGTTAIRNKLTKGATGLKGNGDFFALTALIGAIGITIGTIIDHYTNQKRKNQADDKASLNTIS